MGEETEEDMLRRKDGKRILGELYVLMGKISGAHTLLRKKNE
jgi:hypothetical protein